MSPVSPLRRGATLQYLVLSAALAVVSWMGWGYVHDTGSQRIGAFAFHRLLAYSAVAGVALLAIALMLRVRGAKWTLLGTLMVGIVVTITSLADHASNADSPQNSAPVSPTRDELIVVLLASATILLGVLSTTKGSLLRSKHAGTQKHAPVQSD